MARLAIAEQENAVGLWLAAKARIACCARGAGEACDTAAAEIADALAVGGALLVASLLVLS